MAYLDYEYRLTDTIESVARDFGVPPSELVRINNIQQPYFLDDYLTNIKELGSYIIVPEIMDGRESFENKDRTQIQRADVSQAEQTTRAYGRGITTRVGWASDRKCFITIYSMGNKTYYFPGYPEGFSDSRTSSYATQHPLGRSEPFQIYQNSGPRTVSVTFKLHREMLDSMGGPDNSQYIDELVTAIQSVAYPIGYGTHIPPKVRLVLGNSCDIIGIIEGSISADWGETIVEDRYQMVTLSFSVTEVTGNPITQNEFSRIAGRTQTT